MKETTPPIEDTQQAGCLTRLVRLLAPINRVHHIYNSFGWVLAPVMPRTVGVFKLKGRWRVRVVKVAHFHNCTRTGRY